MKRLTFFTSIAAASIIAATPALAGPGGHGGGDRGGGLGGGINAGAGGLGGQGMGATMRDLGRANSQALGHANQHGIDHANSNSVLSGEAATGTRIPESATRIHATGMAGTKLTGVTTGMTVVDSSGATIGTVAGITTRGNGSARIVQVTLTSGQTIFLSPSSLSLNNGVLTTTSLATNVNGRINSQSPAHASINGLTHASPRSVLASAGVTTLTGLATGLTVDNSGGTAIGTVDSILLNRAGGVVAIRVALIGGGTATIPATTLSMNGTTVVTSSAQF